MSYCDRCGVELEPGLDLCPLCGGRTRETAEVTGEYHLLSDDAVRNGIRPTVIYFRTVIIVISAAAVITGLVDAVVRPGIQWAPMVWISLAVLGTALLGPLRVSGVIQNFAVDLCAVAVLLFTIDWYTGGIGWFFQIGLPLLLSIGAVGGLVVYGIPRVRVLTAAALVVLGAAAICVASEVIVSTHFRGTATVSWSLVVLISTVPLGFFLVLFEHTVGRYIDLRRRFHL